MGSLIRNLFFFFIILLSDFSLANPKGKITGVSFDKALPEDISNENFPDKIESFDFPNATLLDLVKAIGKFTGMNFIVDPSLQGKNISIIAPSSITVAEAYKAFLSALAANGYTIIKSGAFWKIVSVEKAHKENTEVYSGDYFPNIDQIITRIIKLKYINASDFMNSIKRFLSSENNISFYNSTNSIILSDYGSVIERIMKIVEEIDIPGSEEGIHILKLRYTSAEVLTNILVELLSKDSKSSSYISSRSRRKPSIRLSTTSKNKQGGSLKISKIIPDNRTNSLIVSANEEGLLRVKELVTKLDVVAKPSGVYVYEVKHGTAEEVYNTLMGIKSSTTSSGGGKNQLENFRGRAYSRSRDSSHSPLFNEGVTILADTNTNSLIISSKNKYDYESVLAVLGKIDVPRDQVFIQAIIVEMVSDDTNDKKVNLVGMLGELFEGIASSGTNKGFTPFFRNILGSSFIGSLGSSFDFQSLQKPAIGPGFILGTSLSKLFGNNLFSLQNNSFDQLVNPESFSRMSDDVKSQILSQLGTDNQVLAQNIPSIPILSLLKRVSNINVLSTPQLTTMDNIKASIEVGENAPVGLTSTTAVGAPTHQSVDREDVTLKLTITPRINPDSGTVQMDIEQKFDDFSSRSSQAVELSNRGVHITKRNIKTKLVLNDGETAVLGGLFRDKEVKNESKVPLLGDLPLFGWLFKGSTVEKQKSNLLVFITPTIIKGEFQKEKNKEILEKKLEERINFIRKNMAGRDPHGKELEHIIPFSKDKKFKKKKQFFWQKANEEPSSAIRKNMDSSKDIEKEDFQFVLPHRDANDEFEQESSPTMPKKEDVDKDKEQKEDFLNDEFKEENSNGFSKQNREEIEDNEEPIEP